MNPKTIGTYIANTRANMEARIGCLSGSEPRPAALPAGAHDPSSSIAYMLDATVSGQLSDAMEHLRALNGPDKEHGASERARNVKPEAGVVDLSAADYTVIDK